MFFNGEADFKGNLTWTFNRWIFLTPSLSCIDVTVPKRNIANQLILEIFDLKRHQCPPSSSKENGEPLPRPGHENGHAGQHSPPPSRDEVYANRDVLWEMWGDHPRHLQTAIARIASRRFMLPVMLTLLSFWGKYCWNKTGKTNKSMFTLSSTSVSLASPLDEPSNLHVSKMATNQAKYSKPIWARNKHKYSPHDECHRGERIVRYSNTIRIVEAEY